MKIKIDFNGSEMHLNILAFMRKKIVPKLIDSTNIWLSKIKELHKLVILLWHENSQKKPVKNWYMNTQFNNALILKYSILSHSIYGDLNVKGSVIAGITENEHCCHVLNLLVIFI